MIITYLIKSTLCLAVLFGFYKVALESKALHQFKRYYLLASLVFSLTIPLVTFTYTTATVPQDIWVENFISIQDQNTAPSTPIIIEEKTNYLPYVLWSIYGIGILVFGGRFMGNLVRLKRKITTAETHRQPDFTLALLQQTIVPHSFLKYIFLSRKRYENKEIPSEVIAHEATHVRQKHSLDILFIEFLQVVFWFNPLFWITKKSITLNHEFLADQGAIQEQHDIYQYQHILLRYASSTHHTTLESPFNYSSTKKRILMLSQSFNRKRLAISALLLIPIIAGCVLVFNQGIIASPDQLAIEGHWIDHANENQDVYIYKEKDTLWWDQKVVKIPIIVKDDTYFLSPTNIADNKIWELSIAENGFLKLGEDIYFTPPEDTVSYRIDGIWVTPDGKTQYRFITKNGGPTCDVIDVTQNKSTRYYPHLIDNGMTFTIGNDWYTFTFEDGTLSMQDGSELTRIENYSVYKTLTNKEVEHLDIKVLEPRAFLINTKKASDKNLEEVLATFNSNLTREERKNHVIANIVGPESLKFDDINILKEKLNTYGIKQFKIWGNIVLPNDTSRTYIDPKHPTYEHLVKWQNTELYTLLLDDKVLNNKKILEYHPDDLMYFNEKPLQGTKMIVAIWTNPHWQNKIGSHDMSFDTFKDIVEQMPNDYATNFINGAERNGEKALVIEIKKNTVRVNGKPSSVATLRQDIDAITKDWSQEDYREAHPSILVKNPDKAFLKRLNEEFLQTKFSKANGGMDLLPPPPPPPPHISGIQPSAPPAPPAPPASLSSTQVPPPPAPPSVEDHIKSMHDIGGVFYYEKENISYEKALNLVKTNKNLNVQTRSPYTNAPKTYISKEPITFSKEEQNIKPVTEKDIKIYNKLAKKYGNNSNGQILKQEVAFMYDIYNRMTEKQKKNAEAYPAIPPPPPPAPKKVKEKQKQPKQPKEPKELKQSGYTIKSGIEENVDKIGFLTSKIEQHAQKNGVFEVDGTLITKQEALAVIQYPYIGLAEFHTTSPIKMTITKDPMTSQFDIYHENTLLSEKQYEQLASDPALKLKKITKKTKDKKAVYILESI